MQQWIKEVARGQRGAKDLPFEEAEKAAHMMATGEATDVQIATFLTGQRIKTETPEELDAFVKVYRENSEQINVNENIRENLVDYSSPYAGRNSFFATIPVNVLLASRGMPICLHSSNSLPPKYGTTIKDVLTELGINTEESVDEIATSLEKNKIGFYHTEKLSPPLKRLRSIRKEMGIRTTFNTVEKMLNLAHAPNIVLGAFHRTAINKILPVFKTLDVKKAVVVQGIEGSDDLAVHRNSFVFQIQDGQESSFIVSPKEYDLYLPEEEFVKKRSLQNQVETIESVLKGEKNDLYAYNQVVLNTALRLYLFGYESSIADGVAWARNALDRRVGQEVLKEWRSIL
ncbi:anthranilate phosphoribosyltransferase [Priestia filamentosa]|uniref:anthranilate phosphoribosyltransferase n=1 Tax=Priestia filamentosa TaxID=1402861 RepID=UPI0039827ED8